MTGQHFVLEAGACGTGLYLWHMVTQQYAAAAGPLMQALRRTEAYQLCVQVTKLCGDIIGAMSRTRLSAICTHFLRVWPHVTRPIAWHENPLLCTYVTL